MEKTEPEKLPQDVAQPADPVPPAAKDDSTPTVTPNETVAAEKTETTPTVRKPKRIWKKKKPKDALAPKLPLSGYNFFMREIRPNILERNPDDNIQEITKKVAQEWGSLTEEVKRPFLQRADEEKRRYAREMAEYKKTKEAEAVQNETKSESSPSKKAKTKSKSHPDTKGDEEEPRSHPMVNGKTANGTSGIATGPGQSFSELLRKKKGDYEIPIFTDDFLEHNKALDSELRTLRKSQTDYEQQNSILEKHVENMQNGVNKLTGETSALRETNLMLNSYLAKLRLKLVESFSDLAIPPEPNGASLDNIDKYMADLQNMVTSNSHGPASLNRAKDIIRKTDLQINLQP